MHKLEFTKFFDVRGPIGIDENPIEKDAEFHSIGVDVYMPRPTAEFITAICERNKADVKNIEGSPIKHFSIEKEGIELLLFYDNTYHIFQNITIPTGIGILIPKGYYIKIRSKSSNFNNHYTSITGTIDENYTYGSVVQINHLDRNKKVIKILPDEKFAQIVLVKGELIQSMIEIPLEKWKDLEDVQKRRINRTGGFGHTGKF